MLQDVDAIMAARSLDDLMKTEDAEALRSILAALHEFPELDGFIANFCAEFRRWSPEAEQPLRWTQMHKDFVRLVEQRIEQHLQAHGATSAERTRCSPRRRAETREPTGSSRLCSA